jgi:hypothetical protein
LERTRLDWAANEMQHFMHDYIYAYIRAYFYSFEREQFNRLLWAFRWVSHWYLDAGYFIAPYFLKPRKNNQSSIRRIADHTIGSNLRGLLLKASLVIFVSLVSL